MKTLWVIISVIFLALFVYATNKVPLAMIDAIEFDEAESHKQAFIDSRLGANKPDTPDTGEGR